MTSTFLARLTHPKQREHSFRSRRDGSKVTRNTFQRLALGPNPAEYCKGFFEGSRSEVDAVVKRFGVSTAWELSSATLDGSRHEGYLHTPFRVAVDLKKTQRTPGLRATRSGGHAGKVLKTGIHYRTSCSHPAPPLLRPRGGRAQCLGHAHARWSPTGRGRPRSVW